ASRPRRNETDRTPPTGGDVSLARSGGRFVKPSRWAAARMPSAGFGPIATTLPSPPAPEPQQPQPPRQGVADVALARLDQAQLDEPIRLPIPNTSQVRTTDRAHHPVQLAGRLRLALDVAVRGALLVVEPAEQVGGLGERHLAPGAAPV